MITNGLTKSLTIQKHNDFIKIINIVDIKYLTHLTWGVTRLQVLSPRTWNNRPYHFHSFYRFLLYSSTNFTIITAPYGILSLSDDFSLSHPFLLSILYTDSTYGTPGPLRILLWIIPVPWKSVDSHGSEGAETPEQLYPRIPIRSSSSSVFCLDF